MTNFEWIKIAESIAEIPFQANKMCVVNVQEKKITLVQYKEEYFAIAHKCPHASGIMANGFIDALGNAVCPLHRYKFNMKNGRNTTGEGYFLKTYPVEISEKGVLIGIAKKGIWG